MSTWMIIPSDEDIVHGLGGHKYIDRIWKNGKWRYIYYSAKGGLRRMGNKIKKNIGDATGLNQRAQLQRTQEMARKANQSGHQRTAMNLSRRSQAMKKEYDNTALGRLENAKKAGVSAFEKLRSKLLGPNSSSTTVTSRSTTRGATGTKYTPGSYTPEYKSEKGTRRAMKSGESYSPSYKTSKTTTATRGAAYSPSYKTKKTTTATRGSSYSPSYKNNKGNKNKSSTPRVSDEYYSELLSNSRKNDGSIDMKGYQESLKPKKKKKR